jgi:hypothetical protein
MFSRPACAPFVCSRYDYNRLLFCSLIGFLLCSEPCAAGCDTLRGAAAEGGDSGGGGRQQHGVGVARHLPQRVHLCISRVGTRVWEIERWVVRHMCRVLVLHCAKHETIHKQWQITFALVHDPDLDYYQGRSNVL